MNPVAIIQARMTSSRLPGKVLANLAGKPLLERMIVRVQRSQRLNGIVVATTVNTIDDPVVALAQRMGVAIFRGDELDVLGRICAAAASVNADPIVRLTADCPMADPAVIDAALTLFEKGGADYLSNCNRRTFPDGLDVEVISASALAIANREARNPELREHVTPYVRGNSPDLGCGDFRRADLIAPADFGHFRFTVDTAEDLLFLSSLFAQLPDGFGWLDAVALATRMPEKLRLTEPPRHLSGLLLRLATHTDAALLFRWLNETERQAVSLTSSKPVSWDSHLVWLNMTLNDAKAWLAIAVYDGIAAGVVRLNAEMQGPTISLYVDGRFRGRGVGRAMIAGAREAGLARAGGTTILARVRNDNPRSLAFFQNAGFKTIEKGDGYVVLRDHNQIGKVQ